MQFGVTLVHLPREAFFQFMLAAREVTEAMHLGMDHPGRCGHGPAN
jgi:hypothetical protein